MPLLMVCPCGHSAPLPETTGRYRCTQCSRTLEVNWFGRPQAYEQWLGWRIRTGRVAGEVGEKWRVEYRSREAK